MERIAVLGDDLGMSETPEMRHLPKGVDALRTMVGTAAIGTTLRDAISGATDAQQAIDALTLAMEEVDSPDIKIMAASAIADIRKHILGPDGPAS